MQIPLNFITNCCKLKRVLSLFFSIVLPVEKFDLLAGKPPPIKTMRRNKQLARKQKRKKNPTSEKKILVCGKHFWVAVGGTCGGFTAANFDCLASFVAFLGGAHNYLLNY